MIAKFIGQTSMGFISGRTYNLILDIKTIRKGGSVFGVDMNCICAYDSNSRVWCPYQSYESFKKNWVVLEN